MQTMSGVHGCRPLERGHRLGEKQLTGQKHKVLQPRPHHPRPRSHAGESLWYMACVWMVGPSWPNSGEVDIIEGVNSQ